LTAAFDLAAPSYDSDFAHTRLGVELRARVWRRLEALFAPGRHVLELACGTGEDARHLARRGVRVLATDQSAAMLDAARAKTAGLPVICAALDLLTLANAESIARAAPFDGAFSNFGGLNVLADHTALARWLAPLLPAGAPLVMVLMGRWCAWEIAWHLAHGQPRRAMRRLRPGGAVARVGGASVQVHYPATAELRAAYGPYFRHVGTRPLGLFLPPSYLEPLTRRHGFPWRLLAALDRAPLLPLWADHTIYEWVRR
jgi:SAM-dependent methyltransferase